MNTIIYKGEEIRVTWVKENGKDQRLYQIAGFQCFNLKIMKKYITKIQNKGV